MSSGFANVLESGVRSPGPDEGSFKIGEGNDVGGLIDKGELGSSVVSPRFDGGEIGRSKLPTGDMGDISKLPGIKYLQETNPEQLDAQTLDKMENADSGILDKIEQFCDEAKEALREYALEQGKTYASDSHQEQGDVGRDTGKEATENKQRELTAEEKARIKDETGWSDEVIDAIGSMEEYEIYKNAGLVEAKIGDKVCLVKPDIDWNQKDGLGRTNKELAEQGMAPLDKNGKPIELHHIGQKQDSPLAELTKEEHLSNGNDTILHDKTKASEIDRSAFARERAVHWEERAKMEEQEK